MNLSLLSVVGLTLLLCGGVASVPQLARQSDPRSRPQLAGAPLQELWIVQAPGDRWFLAGSPISRADLGRSLRRAEKARVQFLPSAALPIGEVSTSLAWLRRQGSVAVQLALPPTP